MKIIIPVIPRSKKNSQQIIYNPRTKRPMIIQSKLYANFERECGLYLKGYKSNIDYSINLKIDFYVPDKRRRDIVNYIEAIQDILVKYEVIKDDNYNIIESLDGTRMHIDKENPRVEIEITKIE
nr:MAG TPA: Endodeoxyribonuclease RusA [Caudoviricetes sp.]